MVPLPSLARTGSDLARLAMLALSLVGAGLVLVRLGRASRTRRG